MRLVLLLSLLLVALPARAATDFTLHARWLGTWGTMPAAPVDASKPWTALSTPYTSSAVDVVADLEHATDERTMLGTPIEVRGRMLVGWKLDDSRGETSDIGLNMRSMLMGGTLLPVYETETLRVLIHASIDFWLYEPYWGAGTMAMYGGARVDYRLDVGQREVKLRAHYDAKPFWFGTDRMDHELTLRALVGAFGVRVTGMIGQEKRKEGGYPDKALSVALEAAW